MAITQVTGPMVATNAIAGTLIADNAITAVHIATNAVSGTLIAGNAITAVHIAQNVITVTQLADDAVEADKIADGVITTNHLNSAMISSQSEVTANSSDYVLIGDASDSNALKKALVSDFGNTTEQIQDIAGGMFSSNTETGITATYQDGDGTIDLVVGTLNQNTTGTAATVTGAAQSAITSLGTLTTLTVDDITINGSVISDGGALTVTSGDDLTLDVVGDIHLDADGGDVTFKDGGTYIGKFSNSSSNFVITSGVQDKDIIFKGDDGGSAITAMTIDMSAGGNVGIGVTNPDAPLHVVATNAYLHMDGSNYANVQIDRGSTSYHGTVFYQTAGSTNFRVGQMGADNLLHVRDEANDSNTLMVWKQGGNVGIGTDSPSTKLDVNGTITATAYAGPAGSLVKIASTGDVSSVTALTIDNCFDNSVYRHWKVYVSIQMGSSSSDSTETGMRFRSGGGSGADISTGYGWRSVRQYSGHSTVEINNYDDTDVQVAPYNRLDKGFTAVIDIFKYSSSSPTFFMTYANGFHPSNTETFACRTYGNLNNTTLTGIKYFYLSGGGSGNWSNSRMTVYGVKR